MNAVYLLDSNICIDFMRGELPYAYDMMRNSSPKLFKIPAIVEGELRLGIEKASSRKKPGGSSTNSRCRSKWCRSIRNARIPMRAYAANSR